MRADGYVPLLNRSVFQLSCVSKTRELTGLPFISGDSRELRASLCLEADRNRKQDPDWTRNRPGLDTERDPNGSGTGTEQDPERIQYHLLLLRFRLPADHDHTFDTWGWGGPPRKCSLKRNYDLSESVTSSEYQCGYDYNKKPTIMWD